MPRDMQHAIPPQNEYARCAAGGASYGSDGAAMPSRRLSLSCPNCRASILNIPEDILEIEEDSAPEPPRSKRWTKRPHFLSRPLNRKESETSASSVHGSLVGSAFHGIDLDRSTSKHLRRTSVSSDASDSSSQTKVELPPPPRSILTHSPSVSSGKSGKSTLTAKRSVKFSDEPVYYDYSYRFSQLLCTCAHAPHHAPFCKLPYDCNGECMLDDYSFCGYDDDMFSFELPEEIPSERRWGLISRFIAWFRRRTGGRRYTIDEEKRRPAISRPQPLAPRPYPIEIARDRQRRRKIVKKKIISCHKVNG